MTNICGLSSPIHRFIKKLLRLVEQKKPVYSQFLIVAQIKVTEFGFVLIFSNYKRNLIYRTNLFFSLRWFFTSDIVQKIF